MPRVAAKKPVARKRLYTRRAGTSTARRTVLRGRGAYYVRGKLGASAKLPYIGRAEAALEAGYMSNRNVLKGHGSYLMDKIKHNVFLRGEPPEIRNVKSREGAVVIRHREYIGDVISSSTAGAFNIQTFAINPAIAGTFPWLSQIAIGFEEYIISGMVFEFRSTCSDAIASSTNLALGTVGLATQYDPLNPAFTNMQQLLAYEYAQQCKVSENALHMIECARNQSVITQLYTRAGVQPANSDIRLYDFGVFSVATSGLQGTSVNVGQLWISYEILLLKPKLSAQAILGGANYSVVGSAVGQFQPWGGTFVADQNNTLAVVPAAGSFTLPATAQATTYLVSFQWNNAASAAWSAPAFTFTNCQRIKYWYLSAVADVAPPIGTTTTSASYIMAITTSGQNLVPSFASSGGGFSIGSGAVCQTLITQIEYLNPATYGTG